MKNIILYTTEACHLCELAVDQIEQSESFEQIRLTEIDINSDMALLKKFATRVPVVTVAGSSSYLFWPFDHYEVSQWIQSMSK